MAGHEHQMTLKRIVALALKFGCIVIVASLAFCVAVPIGMNEIRAANLARQYLMVSHPAGTERIAWRYGTDKMSNSDSCDFTYLEARSYHAKDRKAIAAYYAGLHRMNPTLKGPRFEKWDAGVLTDISDVYHEFASDLAQASTQPYYTLEAEGTFENAPPFIDWRCV